MDADLATGRASAKISANHAEYDMAPVTDTALSYLLQVEDVKRGGPGGEE
jgi:hypothetical protein